MKVFLLLYFFYSQPDTSIIGQFREFRTAVYTHDKAGVKKFIDFPLSNENGEIWDLVFMDNEKQEPKKRDRTRPFTEPDFDKYFDKIFSKQFIQAILKIKSAELFTTGDTQTQKFAEGKSTTFYMDGRFDKATNTFELALQSKTKYQDEEDGEFSIIYQFKILASGKIKFVQVRLAG